MIALVGALRLRTSTAHDRTFSIRPRWDLESLGAA